MDETDVRSGMIGQVIDSVSQPVCRTHLYSASHVTLELLRTFFCTRDTSTL